MERMNHSGGPSKVQRAYGRTRFGQGETNDLLQTIRQQYPQYFEIHRESLNDHIQYFVQNRVDEQSLPLTFD